MKAYTCIEIVRDTKKVTSFMITIKNNKKLPEKNSKKHSNHLLTSN